MSTAASVDRASTFPEWRIGVFSVIFKFLGLMTSTAWAKLIYKI
jgi:hypothetical protein